MSALKKTFAAGTLATLTIAVAGCTHSSDPNAAPYGAAASPSTAPTAPADAPTGPPPAAPSIVNDSHADASPLANPPSATAPMMGGAAGGGATGGGAMGGPMMGMGGSPTAPLTPTLDLDAKIAEANKGTNKTAIGAAYAERGTARMNDDKAGARVKYRAALDDYRKALAADPTNAEAKKSKDMIESIYKEMGRPIPQ